VNLQERISTLCELGEYLSLDLPEWQQAKDKAYRQNQWFIPEYVQLATQNIIGKFLQKNKLEAWATQYNIPENNTDPATVGLTMAGNIPLVGFHDWLTIFMSGHKQIIKPSSKDEILIRFIVDFLVKKDPRIASLMQFGERLNGCDAFIATGSNNTGRYFEYYFGRYPHIIRKNRTSVAILNGRETPEQLDLLADDILLYFGLGCRNVSKLFVPENYPFEPLLRAMDKYSWMKDHDKFRNNYDYQLSLLILNNHYYMSNEAILLVENNELFSPIACINYEFYQTSPGNLSELFPEQLQCICGTDFMEIGSAQAPTLTDYADGVDTMAFALSLKK
jgi:hypothetical protein